MDYKRTDIFNMVFENEMKIDNTEEENLDSRLREYRRKMKKLAERLPEYADLLVNDDSVFNEGTVPVVFVLLREITSKKSLATKWVNAGVEEMTSREIVKLYETLRDGIFEQAGVDGFGSDPVADGWLQIIDLRIDYTNSKRISIIMDELENIRRDAAPLNHRINPAEITVTDGDGKSYYTGTEYYKLNGVVPNDDVDPRDYENFSTAEQFLSGLENVVCAYREEINKKSYDMVDKIVDIARCCYSIYEDEECSDKDLENDNDFDWEFDEAEPLGDEIEAAYRFRDEMVIYYLKNHPEIADELIKKYNIKEDLENIIRELRY